MGLFARLLAARGLRRAGRPGRTAQRGATAGRGATPKSIKKPRQVVQPADHAVYSIERSITTWMRGKKKRKTTTEWRHGKCPVKHRSREAATRCRNP